MNVYDLPARQGAGLVERFYGSQRADWLRKFLRSNYCRTSMCRGSERDELVHADKSDETPTSDACGLVFCVTSVTGDTESGSYQTA